MDWRCPYCHDRMDRKFRRWHLRLEWAWRKFHLMEAGQNGHAPRAGDRG